MGLDGRRYTWIFLHAGADNALVDLSDRNFFGANPTPELRPDDPISHVFKAEGTHTSSIRRSTATS
jgi:hypothetical protein